MTINIHEENRMTDLATARAEGYEAHRIETNLANNANTWYALTQGIAADVLDMIVGGQLDLEDEGEVAEWAYESADGHPASIWTSTALHLFATEDHIRDLQDEHPYEGGNNMESHITDLVSVAIRMEYEYQVREAIREMDLAKMAGEALENGDLTVDYTASGSTVVSGMVGGHLVSEKYYYYTPAEAMKDFTTKHIAGMN